MHDYLGTERCVNHCVPVCACMCLCLCVCVCVCARACVLPWCRLLLAYLPSLFHDVMESKEVSTKEVRSKERCKVISLSS